MFPIPMYLMTSVMVFPLELDNGAWVLEYWNDGMGYMAKKEV